MVGGKEEGERRTRAAAKEKRHGLGELPEDGHRGRRPVDAVPHGSGWLAGRSRALLKAAEPKAARGSFAPSHGPSLGLRATGRPKTKNGRHTNM